MDKEKLNWRSFADPRHPDGIAAGWNLGATPTLYLIDHQGIIRHKWLGSPGEKAIDQALEKLISFLPTASPLSHQARQEPHDRVPENGNAQIPAGPALQVDPVGAVPRGCPAKANPLALVQHGVGLCRRDSDRALQRHTDHAAGAGILHADNRRPGGERRAGRSVR